MSLCLHIVGKDLRRLRWWLIGWVVLLILPVLIGLRVVSGAPAMEEDWRTLQKADEFLLMALAYTVYLLVILLLQEDGPVGSRQFWQTRPISGRRMLWAKLGGGMVILVGVPVIVAIPWWWWCGFTAMDGMRAAAEIAGLVAIIAIPAALVSALTDSIARALLWSLVLGATVIAGLGFYIVIWRGGGGEFAARTLGGVVTIGVLLTHAAVVVVTQYATRNRLRALWIAASAVGITCLLNASIKAWPDLWLGPEEQPDLKPELAASVTVKVDHAERIPGPGGDAGNKEERWDRVEVIFRAAGVPPEFSLGAAETADHRWTWGSVKLERAHTRIGSDPVGPNLAFGLHRLGLDPETEQWRRDNIASYQTRPLLTEWEIRAGARVPRSLAHRMIADAPSYESRLWIQLQRPTAKLEMPLRIDHRSYGGGRSVRVVAMEPVQSEGWQKERRRRGQASGPGGFATLLETRPYLLSDNLRYQLSRVLWLNPVLVWPDERFLLVNRDRGEAVEVGRAGAYPEIVIHGVGIGWNGLSLHELGIMRSGVWRARRGWLEQATLVLVDLKQVALFHRDISVEKLTVKNIGPDSKREE